MKLHMCAIVTAILVTNVGHSLRAASSDAQEIVGTWMLDSRIDRDAAGVVVPEPSLGSNPFGYLIYDRAGHVAAQIMARDRQKSPSPAAVATSDPNNTGASGGYDAYVGRYSVDPNKKVVTHELELALGPTDVGRKIMRRYRIEGDKLTIQFEPGKAGITRTLVWHRVSR